MEPIKVQLDVSQGKIVGLEYKLPNGKPFYGFKGIPYAEPPLGNQRFAAPKSLEKFKEVVLDCTKERNVCYHKDYLSSSMIGSEDCLFLNVYTPHLKGKRLPVMIWIHGGAFAAGSGDSEYYSPEYLVEKNVIVVTINYRLSILGFLCLPDAGIYGNAGLKDQRLAMQWVQRNIENFNGDPNNVTLFGESAGAACVHFHTLSPRSQRYFHKAICQSGNAIMEWAFDPNMEEKSKILAKLLGCTETDQNKMLKHLRDIDDLSKLLKPYLNTLSADELRRGLPIAFKPTIERETDEAVITKSPRELICDTINAPNIPIIMGYNSKEGLLMLTDTFRKNKIDQVENDLACLIPKSLGLDVHDSRCKQIEQRIREFYFSGRKICEETSDDFIDLLTDYHFSICSMLAVEFHAKYQKRLFYKSLKLKLMHFSSRINFFLQKMYFYWFGVDMELNLYKKFCLQSLGSRRFKGACHADDIYYLFKLNKLGIDPKNFPAAETVLHRFCLLWTNFAKHGEPTPSKNQSIHNSEWIPIDRHAFISNNEWNYLKIDNDKCKMEINPDHDRIKFWRRIFSEINYGHFKANL